MNRTVIAWFPPALSPLSVSRKRFRFHPTRVAKVIVTISANIVFAVSPNQIFLCLCCQLFISCCLKRFLGGTFPPRLLNVVITVVLYCSSLVWASPWEAHEIVRAAPAARGGAKSGFSRPTSASQRGRENSGIIHLWSHRFRWRFFLWESELQPPAVSSPTSVSVAGRCVAPMAPCTLLNFSAKECRNSPLRRLSLSLGVEWIIS